MERSGLFRAMVDSLYDGAYLVDREGRIVYWNKSAEELTGFRSEDVVGRTWGDGTPSYVDERGKELAGDAGPLRETLADGELREAEALIRHRDGRTIPVAIRVSPVRDRKGRIAGAVQVFSENSAMVLARAKIAELKTVSAVDELTGMPSRRVLEQELTSRLDELERFGRSFGVVLFSVDRLERIARSFGDETADDVLRLVGNTLLYNCRPFDFVGRWKENEFLGTVVGVERGGLIKAAERLRSLVATSALPLEETTVRVTVSVGAVMAEWGDTVDVLTSRAERMMLRSRERGRDKVTLWE